VPPGGARASRRAHACTGADGHTRSRRPFRRQIKLPDQVKAAIDTAGALYRAEELRRKNVAIGEVTYFKRFELQVRTSPDHYRNVHLHQGTEIQPRGAVPGPGRASGSAASPSPTARSTPTSSRFSPTDQGRISPSSGDAGSCCGCGGRGDRVGAVRNVPSGKSPSYTVGSGA
jgi:hypothetical protein